MESNQGDAALRCFGADKLGAVIKPDHLFHPSWFKAPRTSKNRVDYACAVERYKVSKWASESMFGVVAALVILVVVFLAHVVAS